MRPVERSSVTRRSLLKAGSGAAVAAAASPLVTAGSRRARAQGQSVRVLVVEDPFFFSLREVLPDFEAETGIAVELESLGYDALQARLVSSFVAKTSDADVITVDQMWSGQYADNGWIIPLNDFAKGDAELDLGDFVPQVLHSMNLWRGNLVTLPIAAYAQGVMYRTDLFDEFGISAPPTATDESWTWDAYLDVLRSMEGKQASGGRPLFPTVMCGAQPTPVVHMFTQVSGSMGAEWFRQFPRAPWDFEPTIDSPEWIAALTTYQDLYKLSPPEAINYTWFDAGTRYSQGDVGMFFWWTPYFYLIKNNGYMSGTPSEIIDSYAVAALPKAAGVDQTISIGGWSLGVPSSSDNQEAGYQFVKWATSAATQRKMAMVPTYNYQFSDFARTSLYADEEVRAIYPYLDVQLDMMGQGNGKITRPPMPSYAALEGIFGLQLNRALSEEGDPAAVLADTKELFTNILKGSFMIPYQLESYDDTLEAAEAVIAELSA